ncbi:MAG: hypothetical protein JWQ09_1782 [Segetibacter sp.]|nr:hypothetical protein [Segetibacter sp.]
MMHITGTGEIIESEEDDPMLSRLEELKSMVKKKKNIDWQRDELLKHIALVLGIDEDERFNDFLNL